MSAKKKYTEEDEKVIIALFINCNDNGSTTISKKSGYNLTFVNRVINNHLNK